MFTNRTPMPTDPAIVRRLDMLCARVLARLPQPASRASTTIDQMRYSHIVQETTARVNCFYEPSIVCVLQGNKKSLVGDREFDYGRGASLYVAVDMPSSYYIYNVSKEHPFLTISFDINNEIISHILNELLAATPNLPTTPGDYGLSVDVMSPQLLDVLLQLTALESTDDANAKRILAPALLTQLYYYLITSQHGPYIRNFFNKGSSRAAIYRVINHLKRHFTEEEDIEGLAQNIAYMQPSTFFKHFKHVTGLSPLQYKKRLRLIEAKKLIEIEHLPVSQSAYKVGYDSLSQFSRDFKRLFEISPSDLGKHALIV